MSPGFIAATAAVASFPMQSSAKATGRFRTSAIAGANSLSDCLGSCPLGHEMGEQNDFASFVDQLNDSWGDTFDTGPIGDLAAYNRYVEVHAYQHAFVLDISVVKRRKRSHARLFRRRHPQY